MPRLRDTSRAVPTRAPVLVNSGCWCPLSTLCSLIMYIWLPGVELRIARRTGARIVGGLADSLLYQQTAAAIVAAMKCKALVDDRINASYT